MSAFVYKINVQIPDDLADPKQRLRFYHNAYQKQWRLADLERCRLIKLRSRRRKSAERKAIYLREHPPLTPEQQQEKQRAAWRKERRGHYLRHHDEVLRKKREYYARSLKYRTWQRAYEAERNKNPEHRMLARKRVKAWQQSHPDKVNAISKRRRARKAGCKSDGTADSFYRFVRSQRSIPCYYCGKRIDGKKAHIDHVIAVSRLGNHSSENLCASCASCNHRKSAKLPSDLTFLDQRLLNL